MFITTTVWVAVVSLSDGDYTCPGDPDRIGGSRGAEIGTATNSIDTSDENATDDECLNYTPDPESLKAWI